MKALIDPNTQVSHVISWNGDKPVVEVYTDSARVAEVTATEFEVALPYFWTDCADNVIADKFWYSMATQQINPVENAPKPPVTQPVTDLPTV